MSSLDTLRRLATEGLPRAAVVRVQPRPRRPAGPPEVPLGAVTPPREPLPFVLVDQAERLWRQRAHPWSPTLAILRKHDPHVTVLGATLEVRVRTSTHRARGIPTVWVPVVLAALTGMELPMVRRALRAGRRTFEPEVSGG